MVVRLLSKWNKACAKKQELREFLNLCIHYLLLKQWWSSRVRLFSWRGWKGWQLDNTWCFINTYGRKNESWEGLHSQKSEYLKLVCSFTFKAQAFYLYPILHLEHSFTEMWDRHPASYVHCLDNSSSRCGREHDVIL